MPGGGKRGGRHVANPPPPTFCKSQLANPPSPVTTSSHAERPFRLVSDVGMRHLWRAAGAPSAQAVGWLQQPRRSRAVESEQARRPPRKARLLRGALAGGGSSVVVGRGVRVACEAPSARRAGGLSGRNCSDALGRGPAATRAKVSWRIRRSRLLRYMDRTAPYPLDQCLYGHL